METDGKACRKSQKPTTTSQSQHKSSGQIDAYVDEYFPIIASIQSEMRRLIVIARLEDVKARKHRRARKKSKDQAHSGPPARQDILGMHTIYKYIFVLMYPRN